MPKRSTASLLVLICATPCAHRALAQEIQLSPIRPTVANSASIQSRGVLQMESGYDAYPGDMQTVDTAFSYVPLDRLRLDFVWSAFTREIDDNGGATKGIATIQLGGKVLLNKENYHKWAPGLAIQYEAELPTASDIALQDYGQQAIVLLNHHYGPNGDLDVIANASIVQSDCQTSSGCRYGGQQSFALSYHTSKNTRMYAEVFAQNNAQSNTPPGSYVFGGFYHQFRNAFGIDGGLRFGVSDRSSSIGATIGFVVGKRIRREAPPH